jgi:hypothetical protein
MYAFLHPYSGAAKDRRFTSHLCGCIYIDRCVCGKISPGRSGSHHPPWSSALPFSAVVMVWCFSCPPPGNLRKPTASFITHTESSLLLLLQCSCILNEKARLQDLPTQANAIGKLTGVDYQGAGIAGTFFKKIYECRSLIDFSSFFSRRTLRSRVTRSLFFLSGSRLGCVQQILLTLQQCYCPGEEFYDGRTVVDLHLTGRSTAMNSLVACLARLMPT